MTSSIQSLQKALLKWYDANARSLPWKENVTPYRVWISEVMLLQTQVGTVLDAYFERFMNRFPDVAALAAAEEQEVLKYWEGLGYYSRARNLHKAARAIVESFGGAFPRDVKEIESLPGIGRYTAGAIASMAFNDPVPILEANTIRIHARLTDLESPVDEKFAQELLWEEARRWVETPKRDSSITPGRVNQALMQFGQQVCKKRPLCECCPLADACLARKSGRENIIPIAKRKPETIYWRHAALVVYNRKGEIYLRQRQEKEHWAGLWDFPRIDDDESDSPTVLESRIRQTFGLTVKLESEPFMSFHHQVTNHKIELVCYKASQAKSTKSADVTFAWVDPAELSEYPLSSPGRRIANKLVIS